MGRTLLTSKIDPDTDMVISHGEYDDAELDTHEPIAVDVNRDNEIITADDAAGILHTPQAAR